MQFALFQAAKVGNIELMEEFIGAGANPFVLDSENCSALMYAMRSDPEKTSALLVELADVLDYFKNGDRVSKEL